ncbi:MAG: dCTP deaminase [Desulfamplus sp.]|nr:dCTP deaminase [Desulfamplus sp.]
MKAALNDKAIKKVISDGIALVDPFEEENLQPASIDLRLGNIFYKYNLESYELGETIDDEQSFKETFEELKLKNGETAFVGLYEKMHIPLDTIGLIMPRSSITRLGIHIVPTYMNPGYSGNMPLTIINHTGLTITLKPMRRVVQLILFSLSSIPEKIYEDGSDSKYFNDNVMPSKLHNDHELEKMMDEILEKEAPILHKMTKG